MNDLLSNYKFNYILLLNFSLYSHCLVLCFGDDLLSTFPGVDVAYELFTAGCDLYNAIKLAYEYNQCCLTSIS